MSRKHLIQVFFHISSSLLILTLLILFSGVASAAALSLQESQKSHSLDYMVLQSGGDLGFVAIGVGKDFGRHKINMLLGYTPRDIGGVEVWQLDFKYDWHPIQAISFSNSEKNTRLDPFYLGISVVYSPHADLFVNEPAQYPDGYYSPTALHYTLNIGTALQYGKHTFFLEYTVSDVGLIAYIKNPQFFIDNYDYLGLEGIGSLAIGIKFKLD